jgi:anti-sigma factor ChrR (cupin superfamily)
MQLPAINSDLTLRAIVETDSQQWVESPAPGVWRKPLDRAGGESGRATSIVRYDVRTAFPPHSHPGGEEIFVLEGVFSDEHGDYPAGTFLLNPPASRHAPRSAHGCVLFVKLCQYGGQSRERIVLDAQQLGWRETEIPGVSIRPLYASPLHPERVTLERFEAGARAPRHSHPHGEEILVIEGALEDEYGVYPRGTWVRNPPESEHAIASRSGAIALVHRDAL